MTFVTGGKTVTMRRYVFFFFDDLKESHLHSVRRLQHFLGAGGNEELAQLVMQQSTHEFMARPENHSKFDDHRVVEAMDHVRQYSRTVPLTGKVRVGGGSSGAGREALPLAVQQWMDWRWQ